MKEIELALIPEPGKKAEFLAKLQVVDPSPAVVSIWKDKLPDKLTLEGYTRETWAWKPSQALQSITVQSTDGRNKLPGFTSYLKQRQKCAYGRFVPTGLLVISYIQPKKDTDRLEIRIAVDMTKIEGCQFKPPTSSSKLNSTAAAARPSPKPAPSGGRAKKGGLLGKLVGAQQRTNHHVAVASAPKPSAATVSQSVASASSSSDPSAAASSSGAATAGARTATQVLNDFRGKMQTKMLDFDIAPDEVLKVNLTLSEYTAGLSDEDTGRVTMEILKYMVYEAAEEVNEEWIAHKEPSEFMDEATIAVYKEGAAPPEVLEEVNKGEIPDEVRAQERALQVERQRQEQQRESKQKREMEMRIHREMDDDFEALNANKRDRRSIEDYERGKAKRSKST